MQEEMRGYLLGVTPPDLCPREIERNGLALRRRLPDQGFPLRYTRGTVLNPLR